MPRIVQFETPALGLRPTETGINATAAAARRVQGEYNEAAASKMALGHAIGSTVRDVGDVATRILDHQQITHGSAAFAGLMAAKSKEWDDTVKNADPNDPTIAQKFLTDNLEPSLEKFSGGFMTERSQAWAEGHVARFREHMFQKTSADMSTLAGQAAVVNHRQTINSLSTAVRNDPSSLDFALSTLENTAGAVVDTSPNLTGAAAGKVRMQLLQEGKEGIIKSAAFGYIEKTGQVPKWIEDSKYSGYVNADEIKQFQKAAQYYDRINKSEERAAKAEQKREALDDFHRRVNDLEAATMPQNVGDRPKLPADYWEKLRNLAQHPGATLEPGRLKAMVTQGEAITARMNKPEPQSQISRQETVGLIRRFRATDDSRLEGTSATSAVYQAYDEGKLSTSDFRMLLNEVQGVATPEGRALKRERDGFFKRYAPTIDPTFGASAGNQQQMYAAEMDARRQEDILRKAGKDPHLVYQPGSEYFFGRPENLARFRSTMQEKVQERSGWSWPWSSTSKEAPAFSPPPSWQWSPSRQQYRDPATGTLYDKAGKEVK